MLPARNQLTGISGPGVSATFIYDGLGRREKKTINSNVTEFLYDGLNPVQETSGATILANILPGLGIDKFLTRTDVVAGVTSGFLTDALGSPIAVTNATGVIQTDYTYEPFGRTTVSGASNSNSYQYTGRENDGTGLFYYRARYYHSQLQRFISEDPIEFAGQDVNLYVYVRNRPIKLIDPYGFQAGDSEQCHKITTCGPGGRPREHEPGQPPVPGVPPYDKPLPGGPPSPKYPFIDLLPTPSWPTWPPKPPTAPKGSEDKPRPDDGPCDEWSGGSVGLFIRNGVAFRRPNCDMASSTRRSTNLKIILEALVLLHTVQFVSGFYLLPFLLQRDLGLPPITVLILGTSITSLLLAVLYIYVRSRAVLILVTPQTLSTTLAGIFLLWIISFIALVWFDKTNPEARVILDLQGSPFYLTVFTVVIVGPFLEEILFRGFFFELLKDEVGVAGAATISTLLFVTSHAIWGGFGPQNILYFVDSLVFTLIYAQGGILAAGFAHSFRNGYGLFLNI